MHPYWRQAFQNRMLRLSRCYLKRQPRSVMTGRPRRWIGNQLALLEVPVRPGLLIAVAPAADADHFVISGPIGKGVVGSVHNHHSSAAGDVLLELRAQFRGPGRTIVVHHDDAIAGELRLEVTEIAI